MAKFLRRPSPGDSDALARGPVSDGASPGSAGAAEPPAVAAAFLRKLDILRDKPRKLRLLKAIGPGQRPWVPLVFLELLADPCEEIREAAVRQLAGRSDWPADALYPRFRRPPWFVKSASLRLAGLRKDAFAVARIRAVLDDANVEVRRMAAWALGEIGGSEARTLLVRLSKDPSAYVRAAAAEAIDRICDFKFT